MLGNLKSCIENKSVAIDGTGVLIGDRIEGAACKNFSASKNRVITKNGNRTLLKCFHGIAIRPARNTIIAAVGSSIGEKEILRTAIGAGRTGATQKEGKRK